MDLGRLSHHDFKNLAITKIIKFSLVTNFPKEIINELNRIQK